MKAFELTRLSLEPLLPPLQNQVRVRLQEIARNCGPCPQILDVGGRKSPYTIGVPAEITVMDLPRATEVQQQLNLGLNQDIINKTYQRRSNIKNIIYGDMTCSGLPAAAFDCIVAVEVLEHVEEDALFVREVARVLRPGGVFLMTTPNGDYVKNTNPDHKRHYLRRQLDALLAASFGRVTVDYAIMGGLYRKLGLKSWSPKHPWQTGLSMFGNFVNAFQSKPERLRAQAQGTHHLIACAEKF